MKTPIRALFVLAAAFVAAPLSPARAQDGPDDAGRRRLRRTAVVEAVEKAAPTVVSIGTTRLDRQRYFDWSLRPQISVQKVQGLGSGVIVHPAGYVVTNAHVINQAYEILVDLPGHASGDGIPAEVVAAELEHDLALLRLTRPGPYPAVRFGRSDDLMVGETVIAVGNPFGLGRTVSVGVVSAIDRSIEIQDQTFRNFIQTDAAVNQGNSGGPLNILGDWIGVNSAIYSLSGGSEGISFAIPVDEVRDFLVRSLRPGRVARRWLGLDFTERDGRVVVDQVDPQSPAERAGVERGSEVLAVEGQPCDGLLGACFTALEATPRGHVSLRLRTARGEKTVRVPYEEFPEDRLAWQHLGLRATVVDAAAGERTGYTPGAGLLVTETRDGGPADRTGLARGDLIIQVGDTKVLEPKDLLAALRQVTRGEAVEVKLLRPQGNRGRFGTWRARLVAD